MSKRYGKGKGLTTYISGRDLGREGHGRAFGGASPYARRGIFIQGDLKLGPTGTSREQGPGVNARQMAIIERRKKEIGAPHEFQEVNRLCLQCHNLREGHDALIARTAKKR